MLQRNADLLRGPPWGWDDERLAAFISAYPQGIAMQDFGSPTTAAKLLFLSEGVPAWHQQRQLAGGVHCVCDAASWAGVHW